jgi:hypothetical protein
VLDQKVVFIRADESQEVFTDPSLVLKPGWEVWGCKDGELAFPLAEIVEKNMEKTIQYYKDLGFQVEVRDES